MDALFHGPAWTVRGSHLADVEAFTSEPRWVTDSAGYAMSRDLLWDRADTLVWLDLPRWQAELRVLRRSLVRGLLRQQLWNGNRESLLDWRDPEHPVRWTWSEHSRKRAQVAARLADPRWAHVQTVHLRTAAEARRWLRTLPPRTLPPRALPPRALPPRT